jgi:methyl-accepting chemotaxis protein
MTTLFLITLLIVFFAFWVIQRTVIRRLLLTTTVLEGISEGEGDLTQRMEVTNRDEIGNMSLYFNKFIKSVHDIVASVKRTTFQMSDASRKLTNCAQQSIQSADEIAKTIQVIAQRVSNQAEMTMSGSDNLKQLGDLIENSKEYMNLTSNSSAKVTELATEGMINIENLAQQTKVSNDAAKQVKEKIERTKASSEKIGETSR